MSDQAFDAVNRDPSLVTKVVEQLSDGILDGRLAPGTRLPSERQLGDQLGVSRTVVREAIRSLAARGLVDVTSGRGVEVTGARPEAVVDSLRLYLRGTPAVDDGDVHELRACVEVATAPLAAERATPEQLAELEAIYARQVALVDAGDLVGASHADVDFHRALVGASGNALFALMLDAVVDVLKASRERTYPLPGVSELGIREHRELLDRVIAKDADGAHAVMRRHLDQADAIYRG